MKSLEKKINIYELTTEEKIKILKKYGYDLSSIVEKLIDEAYNSIIQMKSTCEIDNIKDDTSDDEKKTNKYNNINQEKVILKLLNHILINIKKPEIKDIRDFKKINRDDILKINYNIFNDMEDEITKNFDKIKIGWYRRKKIANYVISFIKSACSHLKDTKFTYKRTHVDTVLVTLYTIS